MTGPDMAQIRADHGRSESRAESAWWDPATRHLGVSARGGFRAGWWQGIEWVLTQQLEQFDGLTAGELLAELRKGPGSIYWPIKADDPSFYADCPRCHRRVLIDVQGLCPDCAHEFNEQD